MQQRQGWMKAMMMAAAVLIGTGAALAQDNGAPGTDVCPHGAADTMLQIAAQAPGISDETQLQNAFAFAKQLPVLCPSDAAVHYFAANTLLVISDLVSDPQSKLERLSEAIAALHDFDAATAGQPSTYESALMDETGTPLSIDLKAGATDLLADYLAPKVVFYEANGLFHAWISTAGQAAAAGGVTTMVTRPDTVTPIDNPETLEFVMRRGFEASPVRIAPMAALTRAFAS